MERQLCQNDVYTNVTDCGIVVAGSRGAGRTCIEEALAARRWEVFACLIYVLKAMGCSCTSEEEQAI